MGANSAVTREDIDDVLGVLDIMMTRIDDRFNQSENSISKLQSQIVAIQNQLDSIEKQIEISEDERLVMAHQLTQLHDWVEKAAKRIDVKLAH
jgi:chromosome segregation ATPase